MLTLFKIATRVKQYKDRVLLHLPSNSPVKALLALVCQRLYSSNRRSAMSPLHDPERLAHETLPPTPAIHSFSRFTPPVGEGQPSPKNQKIAVARGTEPIRKFMQYSG